MTERERWKFYEREGKKCFYCGADLIAFEIDHFIPRSKGGSDDWENLRLACFRCNRSKRDKIWTPNYWTDDGEVILVETFEQWRESQREAAHDLAPF